MVGIDIADRGDRWKEAVMSRKRRAFSTEHKVWVGPRVLDSGRTTAEVGREWDIYDVFLGRLGGYPSSQRRIAGTVVAALQIRPRVRQPSVIARAIVDRMCQGLNHTLRLRRVRSNSFEKDCRSC